MNTLAILRGTFGNFRPLSLTTSTFVNLHRELYHYLKCALSPTCEQTNLQSFGVLSVTFDHYRRLLRLSSIFIENYTITWNARYPQLANTIMLMNTLAILRGTSDHYRRLLRLSSIFIENYTITWNARYRQLVNTIMLVNTLAILRGNFGNFRPLSLTTSACVNLQRHLPLLRTRAIANT